MIQRSPVATDYMRHPLLSFFSFIFTFIFTFTFTFNTNTFPFPLSPFSSASGGKPLFRKGFYAL